MEDPGRCTGRCRSRRRSPGNKRRRLLALLLSLVLTGCGLADPEKGAPAAEGNGKKTEEPYIPVRDRYLGWDDDGNSVDFERLAEARDYMAASVSYEGAEVGAAILKDGGNVVDAAVAAAFVHTVVDPGGCGLAGGGFLTYYNAKEKKAYCISFRETVPALQSSELWVKDHNGAVVGGHNLYGGLSSGVPGEVAGLCQALEKYGTMSLPEVITPAIQIARNGFLMSAATKVRIEHNYEAFLKSAECREIFLGEDGMVPSIGTVMRNEPAARVLERIRDHGPEGFYRGETGKAIVRAVQDTGGVMTLEDLASYRCTESEAAEGTYRGYRILTSGFACSGGPFLIETLNILEQLPVLSFGSEDYWHQLAEVQKLVWADRAVYGGDSRFTEFPENGILSKDYASARAGMVDLSRVQDFSNGDPGGDISDGHAETTALCIADKEGNMAALTHSLNKEFGSKVYVEGCGFFMNDQLGDFVTESGHANSLAPEKQPLSSMCPTVVLDPEGKPFAVLSASGGTAIMPAIAQEIRCLVDYDMNMDDAINGPRIYAMTEEMNYNQSLDEKTVAALEKTGYQKLSEWEAITTGIRFREDGLLEGSVESDFYSHGVFTGGCAIGYPDPDVSEENNVQSRREDDASGAAKTAGRNKAGEDSGGTLLGGMTGTLSFRAEQPVLVTSGGQSLDYQMVGSILRREKLNYRVDALAAAEDLSSVRTLVIVAGGSAKGLGEAGLKKDEELQRILKLTEAAKKAGIPVIAMHTGGEPRRGALSDSFIKPVFEQADFGVIVADGDYDGFISGICKADDIPFVRVETVPELMLAVPSLFR